MLVTVREAAEALAVSTQSIIRWYTGKEYSGNASRPVIDTEELCAIIGLDHRFMMAFLGGYDECITGKEACRLLKQERSRKTASLCEPVFVRPGLRRWRLARYSLRRLAAVLESKKHAKGRPNRAGGSNFLPPPDTLPPTDFGYRSTVQLQGERLPSGRRTALASGCESALPLSERQKAERG